MNKEQKLVSAFLNAINRVLLSKFLTCFLLLGLFLIFQFACNQTNGKNNIKVANSRDSIFTFNTGKIEMAISKYGGRIVSLKLAGDEIITQKSEHENFGSTLWTAPQSNWGWPPFSVLDEQEYKVEQSGNILTMTSLPDKKSGFQMKKSWEVIDSNCIKIVYEIINISDTVKHVGPWEVTRVPCGGMAFFPFEKSTNVPESSLNPDVQKDGINWYSISKTTAKESVKSFSAAKEGWLAYALNNLLFIKQFPDTKPENYSHQQGEVEVYVNIEKRYTELENHGANDVLLPGKSLVYNVNWYLLSTPNNVKTTLGNSELVSLVRNQLKVK